MTSTGISVFIAFKDIKNLPKLETCVRSFFNQTTIPNEIIIVGKKADLEGFIAGFSKSERERIKLVFSNCGKNEARNLGFKHSKERFLIYADHDMEAEKHLIEKCILGLKKHGALIIPEKGKSGTFLENVKKLEKELISYDLDTVTPRAFKREIFKKGEKLFDKQYGKLDEWGFNVKLKRKKISVGIAQNTYFKVSEENLTLYKEIKNKFTRGLWLRNFYEADSSEAWRRVNPIKRGLLFYGKRLNYFFSDPKHFTGLLFIKVIDLFAFGAGYLVGYFKNQKEPLSKKQNTLEVYNKLGKKYCEDMYLSGRWSRYVDKREKDVVKKLLKFPNKKKGKTKHLLDLGMGPGRWSKFFLKSGFSKVTGVDISPVMVKSAVNFVSGGKKFKAVKADMENLPFSDEKFDIVFCFRALKYVDDPDSAVSEMKRVLAPRGKILIEVSNKSLQNLLLKSISRLVVPALPSLPIDSRWKYFHNASFFSKKDIKKISKKHGLKINNICGLFILPSVSLPKSIDKHASSLAALDNILLKLLPKSMFVRSWVFLLSDEKTNQ